MRSAPGVVAYTMQYDLDHAIMLTVTILTIASAQLQKI